MAASSAGRGTAGQELSSSSPEESNRIAGATSPAGPESVSFWGPCRISSASFRTMSTFMAA
eukprot:4489501-Lingulodinium_polyedra.AAC.1